MKKYLRVYIIIPAILLLVIAAAFISWHLLPKHDLDVVVLDKTVTVNKIDENNNITADYRKHLGLYWIMRYERYIKSADDSFYDYKQDYYGPMVGNNGTTTEKTLLKLTNTPDLIYLSDAYGSENVAKNQQSGLSKEEIAVVSDAQLHGSTVVGEFNIEPSKKDDPVKKEMQSLFGFNFGDWVGRYVVDMKDLTDIPEWVLQLYELNYGRQWDYTGSGIILASREGDLVVLKQNEDYSDNLTIRINDEYKSKFGNLKVNYYNWFEIVAPEYGTDSVADYNIPLTDSGRLKFNKVSTSESFPAILVKNPGNTPIYYFAGDFNDYVAEERYGDFVFANTFTRIFTYDRAGDITNFFWNFYTPFMQKVLKEAEDNRDNKTSITTKETKVNSRITGNKFEYYDGKAWKTFNIKGFNINAVMPGSGSFSYSSDISVYNNLINSVSSMGGNCVRAYDLMPPEFYRAIYEFNLKNPSKTIRFYQSIVPPDNIKAGDYLGTEAMSELVQNIRYTIDAVNGNAEVPDVGQRPGGSYIVDVSPYLLGYITEINASQSVIKTINNNNKNYTYSGQYISGSSASTPAENLMAKLCDDIFSYQSTKYKQLIPVGASGNQVLLPNAKWNVFSSGVKYDVSRLVSSEKTGGNFFLAYSLKPSDQMLSANKTIYSKYRDSSGAFAYGGYIRAFSKLQNKYPILIDRVGLSTNINVYGKSDSSTGLSELKQGTELVRILSSIKSEGFLGGLVSDLNDNWLGYSPVFKPFTIPLRDNTLWHNTLDPTENTGILATDPGPIANIGMSLRDTERMREVKLQTDEEYLYMTILLEQETNYAKEELIVGLDTYHKNLGEYLYDSDYFATSLSGMEYVIKFEAKKQAAIYVIPEYNRNNNKYNPVKSYKGKYNLVTRLKYGTFEFSNNNFFLTGSTMHVRIPWAMLNYTDPSNKLVISDTRPTSKIANDGYGFKTQISNGILFSMIIADRKTKDTLCIFPLTKQSDGFKTFTWDKWEKPTYQFRNKESFDILRRYFNKII